MDANLRYRPRPATCEDLKIVDKLLDEAQVGYALVEGHAIAAHGFNRASEDIDILVKPFNDEFTIDVMPSIAGQDQMDAAVLQRALAALGSGRKQ